MIIKGTLSLLGIMQQRIKGYRAIKYATYSLIFQKTRNYANITHVAYTYMHIHTRAYLDFFNKLQQENLFFMTNYI